MKKTLYIKPEMETISLEAEFLLAGSPFVYDEGTDGGGAGDVPEEEWNDDGGL
jgi:hypothetical protein